jgi:isoaspartyl peptidase/L-asparaginase-like protein (Ntn-hydrolase superfamily)
MRPDRSTRTGLLILALLSIGAFASAQTRDPVPIVLLAPAPLPTLAGGTRAGALVVTHGGVGSGPEYADGVRAAADTALAVLVARGSALDAAVAGTVWLEDDPRFNAGTGANLRLDGHTIQMDAAVMTDEGRFAAVGAIERVKNPVRVAHAVYQRLEKGVSAKQAVQEAVAMFPERWDVGLIAVDRTGWGVAANRPMAYGVAGQ